MGLRDLVIDMAALAVDTVEDLLEKVEYSRVTNVGAYDIATDTHTPIITIYPNVTITPIRPRVDQDDFQHIESDQLKVLIAHKHLGFEPTLNDFYTIGGAKYEIQQVKSVPSKAVYILTVRNP